jgi:phospholipid/cholesterol/gamma-HCH transport system substrate-binding protein
MMSRATRIKLLAFFVIAVASVVYVGGKYAGLDRLFGARGYVVTAQLADSGGIFSGAEVAYRGVTIGNVRELHLTPTGVDVELDIDDDSPRIPANATAHVANRSAVGEQYIDLRPTSSQGPFLADGGVIKRDRTTLPVTPDTLLANLDKLVASVPLDSLRTVVDESYLAFADAGPEMQRLLDAAHSFTVEARQNMPDLERLLKSARVVLKTQGDHADDLGTFASGLQRVSKQFAKSDPDLRRVIDRASGAGQELSDLIDSAGTDIGVVLANLLTVTKVAETRGDSLEQTLVSLPIVGAFAPSVTLEGKGQLGLVFDNFVPPSCTKGYESTKQRHANEIAEVEPNKQAYCAEPKGSPISVRGAQNSPFQGRPVAVEPPSQSGQSAQSQELPGLLSLPTAQGRSSGMAGLLGGR